MRTAGEEVTALQGTRDKLLHQVGKRDRYIAQLEREVANLRKERDLHRDSLAPTKRSLELLTAEYGKLKRKLKKQGGL